MGSPAWSWKILLQRGWAQAGCRHLLGHTGLTSSLWVVTVIYKFLKLSPDVYLLSYRAQTQHTDQHALGLRVLLLQKSKKKKKYLFNFIFYVLECYACISVYHTHAWCPGSQGRRHQLSWD